VGFLAGIEELRRIDWAESHWWDIRFPDAPAPFQNWFPAKDVDEGLAIHDPYTLEIGNTKFVMPHKTSNRTLKITFNDNDSNVLLDWFTAWMNGIHNGNQYVTTITSASKLVMLMKKNRIGKELKNTS
jgi:hypothetical protein